jgi:cell division protein FtsI (penicillin-binding protein 3)
MVKMPGHNRLRLVLLGFVLCFAVIAGRAGQLALLAPEVTQTAGPAEVRIPRPDIVDRNGEVLATDIKVSSLYANPRKIIDVDEAIELLTAVVPDMDTRVLRKKLTKDKAFVWLRREVSPVVRQAIHNQGIPGVDFRNETRRVYPKGRLAAHVLGFVDVDSRGLAGIEKFMDDQGALYTAALTDPDKLSALPAEVSLDVRVQHALASEIAGAVEHFKAKAGAGVVLNVNTGEVLALASLPDYNPNNPVDAQKTVNLNRVTTGVFELGSVIKAVTFAMALDSGTSTLQSKYDARYPLVIGRSRINDFHAQKRVLTVPEVFLHSSNIGTARMALAVGLEGHKAFLERVGLFERMTTELPEAAAPLLPKRWTKIASVTASFGHGFAVQPLQGIAVVAALVNGGRMISPTFLKRDPATVDGFANRIIKESTSRDMQHLFRLNALKGTARKAAQNAMGYRVGGKTGTAEKVINGRYSRNHRLTSFVGAFPMDAPKYAVLVMLDEPQPVEGTYGYATSGWNAVPTAGKVISRIAPLLGVAPKFTEEELAKLAKRDAAVKRN